jgi:hypothetical protein
MGYEFYLNAQAKLAGLYITPLCLFVYKRIFLNIMIIMSDIRHGFFPAFCFFCMGVRRLYVLERENVLPLGFRDSIVWFGGQPLRSLLLW